MSIVDEIRHRAARGENFTSEELLGIVTVIEGLSKEKEDLSRQKAQLEAKVAVLTGMTHQAFETASSSRTIDQMREQSRHVCAGESPMFNAFEVHQVILALDISESQRANLAKAHERLLAHGTVAIGTDKVLADIAAGNVHPFSFPDVASLVELYSAASLVRPMKNNVREVFQLLKAHPHAHFYGEEVRLVRQWGQDHERNCNIIKSRLGRAFTDPVGYIDHRFDLMLSKVTKRQLLDSKALTAQAYQHAVFARPDFLKIPENWALCDGKTQFHAGEHFHTATDGTWWCGTQFEGLSSHQLMNILEMALADLRLLHIHFPEGISSEKSE